MYRGIQAALLAGTALNVFVLVAPIGSASAQEAATVIELDTITVEAAKKPVEDAKLPVATTILPAESVPASSPDPVAEIARKVPGTNFMDYGRFGESYMNMRGVGTLGNPLNPLDATVGFSVDEAPTSLSGLGAPLLDVDRVEVLKGPQGTTFGRNAAGGSINVFSRPADGEREFRLDMEAGTDGHALLQARGGGWIVEDTLAARGTLRWQEFGGDIDNAIIGGTEGGTEIGAARGTLRYTPDDTLTIDVTGNYSNDERDSPAFILDGYDDFPASGTDVHPESKREIGSGIARIRKEFDTVTFVSVTSYQDIKIDNFNDFTDTLLLNAALGLPPLTPNPTLTNPAIDKYRSDEHERVFSQELRINSNEGSTWDWVAGVNYFRSDYNFQNDVSSTLWPITGGTKDNDILSQTVAAFGDVSVPLNEKWQLAAGLRIAHDDQELEGVYVNDRPSALPVLVPPGGSYTQNVETSDTYATGRLALSYSWTEEAMTYASVARGYSSGGFDKQTLNAPYGVPVDPFDPAIVWTYELGTKAEVADGVRLNGAVFFNDVTDGQVTYIDAAFLPRLANQDYQSYGVEVGVTATVAEGFDVLASVAFIESEQGEPSADSAAAGAAEGNTVPQIPNFAASLGAAYRFDAAIGGHPGDVVLQADYQYVGERYSDLANNEELEPYHIVNSRVGWEGESISVYAFGRNLLDERSEQFATTVSLAPGASARGVYVGRGRVLGLGASFQW